MFSPDVDEFSEWFVPVVPHLLAAVSLAARENLDALYDKSQRSSDV